MDSPLLLVGFVVLIFVYVWHTTNKLQNQIHCSYHRKDKTVIEKFTSRHSNYIVFDGYKYEVLPDRIALIKKKILGFFSIWVQHFDYYWDSAYPHDPSQYTNTIVSPEVRNIINQEARMGAFAKGVREQSTGKKASGLVQYLPLIAIAGVVILGFVLYTMSQKMNLIEQLIKVGK